jgi:hypothetical protein
MDNYEPLPESDDEKTVVLPLVFEIEPEGWKPSFFNEETVKLYGCEHEKKDVSVRCKDTKRRCKDFHWCDKDHYSFCKRCKTNI